MIKKETSGSDWLNRYMVSLFLFFASSVYLETNLLHLIISAVNQTLLHTHSFTKGVCKKRKHTILPWYRFIIIGVNLVLYMDLFSSTLQCITYSLHFFCVLLLAIRDTFKSIYKHHHIYYHSQDSKHNLKGMKTTHTHTFMRYIAFSPAFSSRCIVSCRQIRMHVLHQIKFKQAHTWTITTRCGSNIYRKRHKVSSLRFIFT